MTAKEYLKRYVAEKHEADVLEKRIKELQGKKMRLQAIRHSGTPKSRKQRDQSDAEAAIDELMEMYEGRILSYVGKETDILQRIGKMQDEEERRVLILKYITEINAVTGKRWTWYDIAEEISCSKRNAQYIHGRALQHFPIDEVCTHLHHA